MRAEGLAEEKKAVIHSDEPKSDGNADVRLSAVNANANRNADQREPEAREGKRDLSMNLHADWRGEVLVLFFPLALHFAQFISGKTLQGNGHIHLVLQFVELVPKLFEGHVADRGLIAFL